MANNRKNFIINPVFQYKFSFIMCTLVFVGSLIYPVAIYDLFEYMISLSPSYAERFTGHRSDLLLYLVITQAAFIGVVFVFCIFVSHKIAGPMYKLRKYMSEIRETGEIPPLTFRDHDYFPEVAEDFNLTMDFLVQRSEDEVKYLTEISDYIENIALVVPEDKKPVLEEIKAKVAALKKYHQE